MPQCRLLCRLPKRRKCHSEERFSTQSSRPDCHRRTYNSSVCHVYTVSWYELVYYSWSHCDTSGYCMSCDHIRQSIVRQLKSQFQSSSIFDRCQLKVYLMDWTERTKILSNTHTALPHEDNSSTHGIHLAPLHYQHSNQFITGCAVPQALC